MKKLSTILYFCFCLQLSLLAQFQKEKSQNMVTNTPASPANLQKAPAPVTAFPYNIDLKTPEGAIINSAKALAAKKKRPVVLCFWLTTCAPCRRELTAINQKYKDWKREADFELFAISTDFEQNAENFGKMVKENRWDFPAYHDFKREFLNVMPGGLNGLPQTFIISPNGEIAYHKKRYTPGDEDALFEKVKELSAKKKK